MPSKKPVKARRSALDIMADYDALTPEEQQAAMRRMMYGEDAPPLTVKRYGDLKAEYDNSELTITAGQNVGKLKASIRVADEVLRVDIVRVQDASLRQGIGTKMYELAAKIACKQFEVPLASDMKRTKYSEGFWQKQVKKGRAEVVRPFELGMLRDEDFKQYDFYYKLSCPAPKSLAGARKRRK